MSMLFRIIVYNARDANDARISILIEQIAPLASLASLAFSLSLVQLITGINELTPFGKLRSGHEIIN